MSKVNLEETLANEIAQKIKDHTGHSVQSQFQSQRHRGIGVETEHFARSAVGSFNFSGRAEQLVIEQFFDHPGRRGVIALHFGGKLPARERTARTEVPQGGGQILLFDLFEFENCHDIYCK